MNEYGSVIYFSHEVGDFEKSIKATALKLVKANGHQIDDRMEQCISNFASKEAIKVVKRAKSGGIPSHIVMLLGFKKKKDVLGWIKKMVITKTCLTSLILNCGKKGFTHRRMHKEFIPENINTSLDENEISFVNKNGEAIFNKQQKVISQLTNRFDSRKFFTAHMFEKEGCWHIFYFDHNDMYLPKELNHYKEGPHIHYISNLWGSRINKEDLWRQLENRNITINSAHVQYAEEDLERISKSKIYLKRIKPQYFMKINNKLACYKDEKSNLKLRVHREI